MKKFRFKNGIHLEDKKESTKNIQIEEYFNVEILEILTKQHIGPPSKVIVKLGEKVKKGQKIAEGLVNKHSPVSGEVLEIKRTEHPIYGENEVIILKNDFKEEMSNEYDNKEKNYLMADKNRLKQLIREKGIVGLGGAAFPTIIKIDVEKELEYLIINGAECEPYLNVDYRLMIEKGKELKEGIKILQKILNPEKTIVGIEDNKIEAIENLKKLFNEENIEISELKTLYPQGGEKQIIQSITSKEVESKKLPINIGLIVINVSTVISIYEAVCLGKPLIEKEITISGDGINKKRNLRVKLGTLLSDILEYSEFDEGKTERLIIGGPMMGRSVEKIDLPITKSLGGILALSKKEFKPYKPRPCILCGKCVYVCPMSLSPLIFVKFVKNGMFKELNDYNLNECINCGACSYICPSNRPLMESIDIGKNYLREER